MVGGNSPLGNIDSIRQRRRRGHYLPDRHRNETPASRSSSIEFPPDVVEATLALQERIDPNAKNSMLLDLEAGKPLEHEWISGEIIRLGQKFGVPTPFHEVAYAALKPFAAGNRTNG